MMIVYMIDTTYACGVQDGYAKLHVRVWKEV